MGVIGFDLYDNDVAGDVQSKFRELIESGISCTDATKTIIENSRDYINDEDDGPIFWIALADTQWEMSLLSAKIKERGIKEIDRIIHEKSYDDKAYQKHFFVKLSKIKSKLNSPMPHKIKACKKALKVCECPWEKGNVYCIRLTKNILKHEQFMHLEGKWIMLQIADIIEEKERRCIYKRPLIRARISKDDVIPDASRLNELELIITGGINANGCGYIFCVSGLTENNATDFRFCGKYELAVPERESQSFPANNVIHYDIDELAQELAFVYKSSDEIRNDLAARKEFAKKLMEKKIEVPYD